MCQGGVSDRCWEKSGRCQDVRGVRDVAGVTGVSEGCHRGVRQSGLDRVRVSGRCLSQ